jgi:hypothetical protein
MYRPFGTVVLMRHKPPRTREAEKMKVDGVHHAKARWSFRIAIGGRRTNARFVGAYHQPACDPTRVHWSATLVRASFRCSPRGVDFESVKSNALIRSRPR